MRVCYVTNLPNLNGSNRSLLDMLDGMERNVVEPIVMINGKGPIIRELQMRDIQYRIVNYAPSTNSDNLIKNAGKRILNSYIPNKYAVFQVERLLKEENVNILHANNLLTSVGMEAAYKCNIPYICHLRDYIWEDHHRKFINEKRQYYYLGQASKIIAISSGIAEKYKKLTPLPIEVINDGIKIDNYILPYKRILHKKDVNLLMAGRIAPGKGQLEAMKAVKVLHNKGYRNLYLHIAGGVGDDKYYKKLIDYKESNNLVNVMFHPFVNDLRKLRSACDIGLTCSHLEGLGRVTIENMLSSLLVICADTGGSKDIVRPGENGLLYKEGNIDSLIGTIQDALEHPETSNGLAAKGYKEAQFRFDYIDYSSKIVNIYKQIIGQK